MLDAVGISWDLSTAPRQAKDLLCYSNFWVGNAAFWDAYVGNFLGPIADFIRSSPNRAVVRQLFDNTQHTSESPFLPFIIERLFSTFLSFNPQISVAALQLDPALLALNEMERHLVGYYQGLDPSVAESRSFMSHTSQCRQMYNGLLYGVIQHPHIAGEAMQ